MSNKAMKSALAFLNAEAGTRNGADYEQAWMDSNGSFVTEDHFYSDQWYGMTGFSSWENPGPDWTAVTRRVHAHVQTGKWEIEEAA